MYYNKETYSLAKYFEDFGLKTTLGRNGDPSKKSTLFEIVFDKTVTKQDIHNFMDKHWGTTGWKNNLPILDMYGMFVERLSFETNQTRLLYIAESLEKANLDLAKFKEYRQKIFDLEKKRGIYDV